VPIQDAKPVFQVKDCALVALATGRRAQTLGELRDNLGAVEPESIYHHFWGGMLRPRFDEPEFKNDFAAWARHALHDYVLSERLALVDPTLFDSLEELRAELVEVCEERLHEVDRAVWAPRDQRFHFLTSKLVVFDTGRRLEEPAELAEVVPQLSRSSIFYHFIDARRRHADGVDDFRAWLRDRQNGYGLLCERLLEVDPFFSTLGETRDTLARIFAAWFNGGAR
jgi:hypothetical protein